ncbi:MAG TPA: YkvA family protein [Anaerolineales bacterium]
MANKHDIISNQNSGFFQDLILRIKLILRLIGDRRVNFLLKLLPIAAAIYVISPVDLIPGAVFPVIGALDDAVVIWLGTTLFVTLCPDDIVQEHTNALNKVVTSTWRDATEQDESGGVIEAGSSDAPDDV